MLAVLCLAAALAAAAASAQQSLSLPGTDSSASASASAPSPAPGLYGLLGGRGSQLVKIDPATAKTTPVGAAHPAELDAQGVAAIDAARGMFYFVGFNASNRHAPPALLGQSLETGAFEINVPLPFPEGALVGVGQDCVVEPKTGNVFVAGPNPKKKYSHHVYRVSTQTGKTALIKTINNAIDVLGGSGGYDTEQQVLWLEYGIMGKRPSINLFGIDARVGHLAYNITNDVNMETFDYDPKRDVLVGIGLQVSGSDAKRTIVTLDSKTGKFATVCTVADLFILDGGRAAYDASTSTVYAYMAEKGKPHEFYLVGINTNTCAYTKAPACTETPNCPWNLGYAA